MIPISEEMVQEQRRQDLALASEKHLLKKQYRGLPASPARAYHVLLARLGDLLYEAGCHLRRRYAGSRSESPQSGQAVQPTPTLSFTAYRGFGGGYQIKPMVTGTGGNSTPCSGS
jgi:hypothetical protein